MNNGNEYKKTQSRKWRLVLYVLAIATLGVFLPPILSNVFGASSTLVILTGGHFVTLVTLIVSAYFGANVLQKKFVADSNGKSNTKSEIKANENGEA